MASTGNVMATVDDGKVVGDNAKPAKKQQEAKGTNLGYDDFLTLLCAEMQYQDPLEPTSNTEYVAQLATFSQLEATLSMQTTQENEMANALVGKYVILRPTDEATGKTTYVDGKVDYIMYQDDGKVMLSVNDSLYSIDDLDTVADSDYYEAVGLSKTIDSMVAQLPDIENITADYAKAIKQIRDVYDGMTSYQQKFVSSDTLAKLQAYENRVAELGGTDTDETGNTDEDKTVEEAAGTGSGKTQTAETDKEQTVDEKEASEENA